MALTTTYGLMSVLRLDLSVVPSTVATDVAALAGGGFVGIGNFNGHTAVDLFDANGLHTGGTTTINGIGGSAVQLASGNLLVASIISTDEVFFSVRSLTGSIVIGDTQLRTFELRFFDQVDATGLGGDDFAMVGSDRDFAALLLKRMVNGVSAQAVIIPTNAGTLFDDPSIAGIGNGSVAVAYALASPTGSVLNLAIWNSVFDPNVALPLMTADALGTINRNPSVVDLPGAGFGIAYETNGQSATLDVVFSLFSDTGTRRATFDISNPGFASNGLDEGSATASLLTDTLVAISYSERDTSIRTNPRINRVALFDLTTNTVVANVGIGSLLITKSSGPMVAGLENGRIAFFATDTTSGSDAFGRLLAAERTQVGDAANDLILGDELKDVMLGGDGNDTLIGGSGAADDLHGGLGADTFRLSGGSVAQGEVIAGDGGADRIQLIGTVRLDLASLTSIEKLVYAGAATSTANLLATQFGPGLIWAGSEVIARAGLSDRLVVNMAAATALNLAPLTFTAWQDTGPAADLVTILGDGDAEQARGTQVRDVISLGGGDDILNGDLGNDVLTGGAGADRFVFSTPQGSGNIDRITDFQPGLDDLRLDDAMFAGLTRGPLLATAFEVGASASSAQVRIFYNDLTGALFFDADGRGGAAAQRFATLDPGLALQASDILVF